MNATQALAAIYAVPDDGAFHNIQPGILARKRDDGATFIVSISAEYVHGDPNLGYADGCPAALLSEEIPVSAMVDSGSEGEPGAEWWIIRGPAV